MGDGVGDVGQSLHPGDAHRDRRAGAADHELGRDLEDARLFAHPQRFVGAVESVRRAFCCRPPDAVHPARSPAGHTSSRPPCGSPADVENPRPQLVDGDRPFVDKRVLVIDGIYCRAHQFIPAPLRASDGARSDHQRLWRFTVFGGPRDLHPLIGVSSDGRGWPAPAAAPSARLTPSRSAVIGAALISSPAQPSSRMVGRNRVEHVRAAPPAHAARSPRAAGLYRGHAAAVRVVV